MNYFTIGDVSNQGFYPLPEKLFNNKHYQKKIKKVKKTVVDGETLTSEIIVTEELLTDTSKIIYAIMCRYLNLSIQNGWVDKKKRIYVRLSLTTLSRMLNKSRDTIIKSKKQLESVGLLKIVKTQYKSDTFYLGKVKNKEEKVILQEHSSLTEWGNENDLKSEGGRKYRPVEKINQCNNNTQVVENIDHYLVEKVDPIIVSSIRVNNRAVAENEKNTAASTENFIKKLKEILIHYKITGINKNSLSNLKKYSNCDIDVIKKALIFMSENKKPFLPGVLIAIIRDRDFEQEIGQGRELKRAEKIEYMSEKLGVEEVLAMRKKIIDDFGLGFDGQYVDDELGNRLCQLYNQKIRGGNDVSNRN